jgi:hypothetical protein
MTYKPTMMNFEVSSLPLLKQARKELEIVINMHENLLFNSVNKEPMLKSIIDLLEDYLKAEVK